MRPVIWDTVASIMTSLMSGHLWWESIGDRCRPVKNGHWCTALIVTIFSVLTVCWKDSRVSGDSRGRWGSCDVTVMNLHPASIGRTSISKTYGIYPRQYAHALQWRHNERDDVSNHWRLECVLNRLFRRRSKKTSKLRVTGFCEGNPLVAGGSPHKGPVTQEMFPFDNVIMVFTALRFSMVVSLIFRDSCSSHTVWKVKKIFTCAYTS